MALRNQPYLPLYVSDFITDEKLAQCSAAANGVYIRIMCLMHKSEHYGRILLKPKHKQRSSHPLNFASTLSPHLPYPLEVIEAGLLELLEENVLIIEGDLLIQKRMVKDFALSELRSKNGKKGGEKTQQKNHENLALAKPEANAEYEYNSISSLEFNTSTSIVGAPANQNLVVPKMMEVYLEQFPAYFQEQERDWPSCQTIARKVEKIKNWHTGATANGKMEEFLSYWREVVQYVRADKWLSSRSLSDLSTKEWQRLGQHMHNVEQRAKEPPKTAKARKEENLSEYEKQIQAQREAAKNKTPE